MKGWKDHRANLTLCWANWLLQEQPDFGIHENVAKFDQHTLEKILHEKYLVHHIKVAPSDLNWSVISRPRLYSVCFKRASVAVERDIGQLYQELCQYVRRRVAPLQIPAPKQHHY